MMMLQKSEMQKSDFTLERYGRFTIFVVVIIFSTLATFCFATFCYFVFSNNNFFSYTYSNKEFSNTKTKFIMKNNAVFVLSYLYINAKILSSKEFNVKFNQYLDSSQFGSTLAQCEYSALKLGSDMADVFNAPVGDQDWDERVHQDFITEQLGFAPWMAHGTTLTNKNSKELQERGGWHGKDINDSPYAILNHKWVYMFGDSTTRQVWASFAASFQGNNFERNAKEWTRHYCNKQSNRVHHAKGGHFDDEGWRGPCGVNEVTCHVSGFGSQGLLSFDWKHFPFEDYDSWFWGNEGPWIKGFGGEGERRPDMLTVQFGMHSCWHASPQGLYSGHLREVNSTMLESHLNQIPVLMASIRRAVDFTAEVYRNESLKMNTEVRAPPIVVIVTSGATGMGDNGTTIDNCILRFNRIASVVAHQYGFAVLERGEIERRLMYKSLQSPQPLLAVDMHLPQPAQNIVATSLLHLFTCLNQSSLMLTESERQRYKRQFGRHGKRKTPQARPIFS